MKYIFLIFFGCAKLCIGSVINDFLHPEDDADTIEEIYATTPELIKRYNYETETHHVTTEDGYILELHRITRSPNSPSKNRNHPVLLMHGLFASSESWVMMRPANGLGFLLADQRFDVWLGNARGNQYSRNHTTFNPDRLFGKRKNFWNFSWHEMGIYDLPATIDYILKSTGKPKLHYVGHSQGTTEFFVMCSERPEYNDKIVVANLLAPLVYLRPTNNKFLNSIRKFSKPLYSLSNLIGFYETKTGNYTRKFGQRYCSNIVNDKLICDNALALVIGKRSDQLDGSMLPAIFGHIAPRSSTKTAFHTAQLVNADHFQQFDYGRIKNRIHYKASVPPLYNLQNARARIIMYYVEDDGLVLGENVERLVKQLSNVVNAELIDERHFNHMDFIWSKNVRSLIYDNLIEDLELVDQFV